MSYLIIKDPIVQSVINTAAEVPVFNKVFPAGLWPGNVIKVEQTGRYCNGSSNGRNYIVRLKVDGVTLFRATISGTTSSASYYAGTQRWILAATSTRSIAGVMYCSVGGVASDTGNFAVIASPGGCGTNVWGNVNMLTTDASYIDLSTPTAFEITVQLSVAAATHEYQSLGVYGMLLGDALTPAVRPDLSAHPRRNLRRAA